MATLYNTQTGGTLDTGSSVLSPDFSKYLERAGFTSQPPEPLPTQTTETQPVEPRPILTGQSEYQKRADEYFNGLNTTMPDRDLVRQQLEAQMNIQRQIDSINDIYAQEISKQREIFTDLQGQRRALSSRGGRLGAPIDIAQKDNITQRQAGVEKAVNAEKGLKIQQLYDRLDERVEQRFRADKEEALGNRENYLNFLKGQEGEARSNVLSYFQAGGTIEDLPKERLQQILDQTGYDEFALNAIMTNNNPQTKAQYTTVGDKVVGYYFDPATQQIKTFESKSLGELESGQKYTTKETADGSILLIPETIDPEKPLDEQIKMYGTQGQFMKAAAPAKNSSGGGGGGINQLISTSQLSEKAKAVYENPGLISNFTATEKGKILDELARAGLDLNKFAVENIGSAQRTQIAGYDDLIRQGQEAEIILNETNLNTGPIASRIKAGQAILGGAQDFTTYRSIIDNMGSALLKLRSGAAVTPQEFERIKGFIPGINDDEKTAKVKIVKFYEEMNKARENYVKRATQTEQQILESVGKTSPDPLNVNNTNDPLKIN